MKMLKIRNKEWMEMNQKQRIKVLLTYSMSYKEAFELCEVKKVSDLPGQLLPLEVTEKEMKQICRIKR